MKGVTGVPKSSEGKIWGCPCFLGLLSPLKIPGNTVVTLPAPIILGSFSLKSSGKGHVEAPSTFPVGFLLPSHPPKKGCGKSLSPFQAQEGWDFRILHVFGVPFPGFRSSLLQVKGAWTHAGGLPKPLWFSTDFGDIFPVF